MPTPFQSTLCHHGGGWSWFAGLQYPSPTSLNPNPLSLVPSFPHFQGTMEEDDVPTTAASRRRPASPPFTPAGSPLFAPAAAANFRANLLRTGDLPESVLRRIPTPVLVVSSAKDRMLPSITEGGCDRVWRLGGWCVIEVPSCALHSCCPMHHPLCGSHAPASHKPRLATPCISTRLAPGGRRQIDTTRATLTLSNVLGAASVQVHAWRGCCPAAAGSSCQTAATPACWSGASAWHVS